jgi:hypothetical protein
MGGSVVSSINRPVQLLGDLGNVVQPSLNLVRPDARLVNEVFILHQRHNALYPDGLPSWQGKWRRNAEDDLYAVNRSSLSRTNPRERVVGVLRHQRFGTVSGDMRDNYVGASEDREGKRKRAGSAIAGVRDRTGFRGYGHG